MRGGAGGWVIIVDMLEPYESENLIFIDTEFTDLDPYTGEILSIGIAKLSGEELYLELECDAKPTEWVTKNIIPTLKEPKVSRDEAIVLITEFLDDAQPFAVGFVDNYDAIYMTKIFGAGQLPFRWVTIDFASILFAIGINPVKFLQDQSGARSFYKKLGIDMNKYRQHHALDDARLLREAWMKISATKKETSPDIGT
ncbi:MAG: DNA polymerase III epsilon subunit-like protein [Candidatus Saccharimonadales bacterium]|jgi:DNA polymerase III epsilon subunit-like protein